MPIKVRSQDRVGDVVVLNLKGRLTAGIGVADFQRIMAEQMAQGNRRFAFGLAKVRFIDDEGLAAMVDAWDNTNGNVVLFGLGKLTSWKLYMSGAGEYLKSFPNGQTAAESFFRGQVRRGPRASSLFVIRRAGAG